MTDDRLISHVSDTARWVAVYRAMETERPDAHFRDPFARRLAGPRGEAIVNGMTRGGSMAWPMVVRTVLLDEIIARLVADGVDTVLNLAAGLDARAFRMALPAALHWIDVDHPDMIQYKTGAMADETPACRYEAVPLDLTDANGRRALFARVNAAATRTLVITEGLLLYLTEGDVIGLSRDLHACTTFTDWLSDLASPGLIKMLGKSWGPLVAAGNAPFQFGPAEGPTFFAPYGWRLAEYRPLLDEGIRLHRHPPMARFFRWLGTIGPAKNRETFKYFSGVMLLSRQ